MFRGVPTAYSYCQQLRQKLGSSTFWVWFGVCVWVWFGRPWVSPEFQGTSWEGTCRVSLWEIFDSRFVQTPKPWTCDVQTLDPLYILFCSSCKSTRKWMVYSRTKIEFQKCFASSPLVQLISMESRMESAAGLLQDDLEEDLRELEELAAHLAQEGEQMKRRGGLGADWCHNLRDVGFMGYSKYSICWYMFVYNLRYIVTDNHLERILDFFFWIFHAFWTF